MHLPIFIPLVAFISTTVACVVTDLAYDSSKQRLYGTLTDNSIQSCSIAKADAFRTLPTVISNRMAEVFSGCGALQCIDSRKTALCRDGDLWMIAWNVENWVVKTGANAEDHSFQMDKLPEGALGNASTMRGGERILLSARMEEEVGLRLQASSWGCTDCTENCGRKRGLGRYARGVFA